jgi:hypothetical protein
MKTEARSTVRNIALALLTVIPVTQIAVAANVPFVVNAQADAAAQAAAQAIATQQMSMQATQQANDQAMQAAQQANAQAMQAAQDASSMTQSFPVPVQQQTVSAVPNGPIPAQIAAAHTVFLTNAGADANFPVDENTAYTKVFTALQDWGRYQFVTAPAQADLIFQLRDIAPITNVTGYRGGVYTLNSPAFELTIIDAKTNMPLWTVTSPVQLYGSGKTEAKWFAIAMTNLVSRVKVLANQPLTVDEQADLTTFPANHGARNALIWSAVGLGVLGGATVLAIHFAKNSQDSFCTAHGIPLSQCAGG